MTLHPIIPNPYTLLSLPPLRTKVYTCLDLKDAFFCIHLPSVSQPIFGFEWEDPIRGTKQHTSVIAKAEGKVEVNATKKRQACKDEKGEEQAEESVEGCREMGSRVG